MIEVRERKEKLKQEIRLLESGFENRVTHLKDSINEIRKPARLIKNSPVKSVAIAVGIGFAVGLLKKKRKRSSGSGQSAIEPEGRRTPGITSFIVEELQHLAAQKAMMYLSELIDKQISGLKKNSGSDQ